jgi:hypothetical protein
MVRRSYRIYSIERPDPDDLWLGAVSFEPRCINAAKLLASEYLVRRAIVFRYQGPDEQRRRERHQSDLRLLLREHLAGEDDTEIIYCDKDDPLDGLYKLEASGFGTAERPRRITIDLTTFTKQYMLALFRWLEMNFPEARVRTVYTEARYRYPPQCEPRLTWGVKSLVLPPFYGGVAIPELPDLLIVFLGYEAERAYRVWRTLEPERTVAVLGWPPVFPGAEITVRALNRRLLARTRDEVQLTRCSAMDPDETCALLCELASTYRNHNISIAPLGSKMQALGTYLYFRCNPATNAQVVYAVPVKYDESYYGTSYCPYVYEYWLGTRVRACSGHR